MSSADASKARRLVALLPAAGSGSRLGLDGSKEAVRLHPGGPPVISHALGCASRAGAASACVVLREGKQDIQDALGGGWNPAGPSRLEGAPEWQLPIDYLVTEPTPSAVHTLTRASAATTDCDVLLAFPDILFQPVSAGADLARKYYESEADVALALFPSERPDKADMVELDEQGRPVGLVIKKADCKLRFTWGLAIWGPRFSELLRDAVGARGAANEPEGSAASNQLKRLAERDSDIQSSAQELFVGDVFKVAIEQGFRFEAVCYPQGLIVDVGTPGDLERARKIRWPAY